MVFSYILFMNTNMLVQRYQLLTTENLPPKDVPLSILVFFQVQNFNIILKTWHLLMVRYHKVKKKKYKKNCFIRLCVVQIFKLCRAEKNKKKGGNAASCYVRLTTRLYTERLYEMFTLNHLDRHKEQSKKVSWGQMS